MIRLVGMLAALIFASTCGGDGGDVEGVAYGLYGERLAGALVSLNGDSDNLVVTGADGAFKFNDVTAPYNLTLIHERQLLELQGLRERKLRVPVHGYVVPREARLAGTVEGVDFPLPDQQQVLVSLTGNKARSLLPVDRQGAFQGELQWDGPSTIDGDLVAVQLAAQGEGTATFLLKGARKGLRVNEDTSLSDLSVILGSEIRTRETLLIHGPGTYDMDYSVWMERFVVQGASFHPFLGGIPSGTRVSLPSEGGTFVASGWDSDGNQAVVVMNAAMDGTTRIELPLATSLKAVAPVDTDTEGPNPTFLWTPVKGAKSIALFLVDQKNGAEYTFVLPGKSNSFRLPNYGYGGMGLKRDTTYGWGVTAHMNEGWAVDDLGAGNVKDALSPHRSFHSSASFRTGN